MSEENQIDYLNPDQQKFFAERVDEAVASLVRQDGEKDHRKQIATDVKEELGLSVSDFNRVVRVVHERSIEEKERQTDELRYLYEVATRQTDSNDENGESDDE